MIEDLVLSFSLEELQNMFHTLITEYIKEYISQILINSYRTETSKTEPALQAFDLLFNIVSLGRQKCRKLYKQQNSFTASVFKYTLGSFDNSVLIVDKFLSEDIQDIMLTIIEM